MHLPLRFLGSLAATAVAGLLLVLVGFPAALVAAPKDAYLSPTALAATRDGQTLFIACATANRVLVLDTASRKVMRSIPMPAPPLGLALSPDDTRLYVTCAAPNSKVCIVDVARGKTAGTLAAGHTAMAPVLSPDGTTLYACNRFNNDVSVFDLRTRKELRRVPVAREPVAAAVTADGKFLLVANLLPTGRADADTVTAVVSVIDTAAGRVVKELPLPNGSGSLNDLRVSPDGKFAVVSHILSRFHLPTTQLDRGWLNTNAKTIIDLARMEVLNTVLLDTVDSGAANPWGIAWSADSATVVVAHAGTHELSVINFPALLAKLAKLPARLEDGKAVDYNAASHIQTDVPNDLSFLVGVRQRLKLPPGERGPRAVVLIGTRAYVANYFSDTLAVVDVAAAYPKWESIALGPKPEPTIVRLGEMNFHDASLCFQGWQSCATCHPGEARVDALNWDLLNDGIGNPKNTKSMLLTHRTPPAMSLSVRETGEQAVRAGLRHILFTVQPEAVPQSMDEYLKALKPVPSPQLVKGQLSDSAQRGKKLFQKAACASCHPAGLFTDLQHYDVGTRGQFDKPAESFDTPTLVELWRTAPYLHDGSAATVREVFATRNPRDRHGQTSNLSGQELDDLCAYLLSL
jgi:YVTN family beta-propeller protein